MKFAVVLSVFISVAAGATLYENSREEVNAEQPLKSQSTAGSKPEVFDILGKLTSALGQAVAKNEGIDSENPLKTLMGSDFMRSFGSGDLQEIDDKLKEAIGNFDTFKDYLGGAKGNPKNPVNIANMFPPKVLNDIFSEKIGTVDEDAHAAVDEEMAKLFKMDKEKVAEFRRRTFSKMSEIAKGGDLNLEDMFDLNSGSNIFRDL